MYDDNTTPLYLLITQSNDGFAKLTLIQVTKLILETGKLSLLSVLQSVTVVMHSTFTSI